MRRVLSKISSSYTINDLLFIDKKEILKDMGEAYLNFFLLIFNNIFIIFNYYRIISLLQ